MLYDIQQEEVVSHDASEAVDGWGRPLPPNTSASVVHAWQEYRTKWGRKPQSSPGDSKEVEGPSSEE